MQIRYTTVKHLYTAFPNNIALILTAIFTFSIIISFLYLLFFSKVGPIQHNAPGTDYFVFYKPVAVDILNQNNIFTKQGTHYPIGYPSLLAGLLYIARTLNLSEINLIFITNAVMFALSSCFVFMITKEVFNKPTAILSSVLFSTYPIMLWFLKNPHTEQPFILLFYISIWLLIVGFKKKKLTAIFISGIFLGLTALVHAIIIFIPFILAILLYFFFIKQSKAKALISAIILILGYALATLPWIGYTYYKTKEIVPLARGGVSQIAGGLTYFSSVGQGGNRVSVPPDVMQLLLRHEDMKKNTLDYTAKDILFFLEQEVINHPITLLKFMLIKAGRAWYATSQKWWEGRILLLQTLYLIPACLGIYISFRKKDVLAPYIARDHNFIIMLLIIIGYFWAITVIVVSILRYMVPVMGFVLMFTAFGLYSLWRYTHVKHLSCKTDPSSLLQSKDA